MAVQLIRFIGFSKSFKRLLQFCYWYFLRINMNVTTWYCLYYSEFPTDVLPIQHWNKFEGWVSDTTLKSWTLLCISKDYSPSSTIYTLKKMLIIAPSEVCIHTYICCIPVYIYEYYSKFHTKMYLEI
jgi:hypothetical protein